MLRACRAVSGSDPRQIECRSFLSSSSPISTLTRICKCMACSRGKKLGSTSVCIHDRPSLECELQLLTPQHLTRAGWLIGVDHCQRWRRCNGRCPCSSIWTVLLVSQVCGSDVLFRHWPVRSLRTNAICTRKCRKLP